MLLGNMFHCGQNIPDNHSHSRPPDSAEPHPGRPYKGHFVCGATTSCDVSLCLPHLSLSQAELSIAGLRGLSADLCQVTSAMQDMAAGLHSTKEGVTIPQDLYGEHVQ